MSATTPKNIKTLAQLRKEIKPEKSFTFTVEKDLVLVFEDFNYFDDDRHLRMVDLLDKVNGHGVGSYREVLEAVEEVSEEWLGTETYKKLKEAVPLRMERAHIIGEAGKHFTAAHGTDDPKGQ